MSQTAFPLPWRVDYWRRCEEWHPQSMPRILDANGVEVCRLPQTVGHPGMYDSVADETAKLIVEAVNIAKATGTIAEHPAT